MTTKRPRSRRRSRSRPTPSPSAGHLHKEKLTIQEAAERLGLTDRRLRQLIAEHRDVPYIGRGKDLRFLWPQIREWRDKQLIQQGVHSVRAQSVEEARARKLTAEADLREMEAGERRGSLMPAALYRQELEAAYMRVQAHQLNAPDRYAPQLLEELADRLRAPDLLRIQQFLRRMMREQMGELQAGDDVPEDLEPPQVA
jgi:hypothetical protein